MKELLASDYIEEGLQEFIESYSRTDEVLPSDKTLGFVVVNSNKKVISFSFTSLSKDVRDDLSRIGDSFKQIGYSADLDLAQ